MGRGNREALPLGVGLGILRANNNKWRKR